MRIKIIGDNNCARATRQLLRQAGFAVTEFLPVDAVIDAPHAGYAITIDLAPALHTPPAFVPGAGTTAGTPTWVHADVPSMRTKAGMPSSAPERVPHDHTSTLGETSDAREIATDASSLASLSSERATENETDDTTRFSIVVAEVRDKATDASTNDLAATIYFGAPGRIHFDSVDCALEAAVLRHVTELAKSPVVVDRPGGVVRSDRELRVIVPLALDGSGIACMDEAAAVAVEFGVLRGLLDLATAVPPVPVLNLAGVAGDAAGSVVDAASAKVTCDAKSAGSTDRAQTAAAKKWWWIFGVALMACSLLTQDARLDAAVEVRSRARDAARVSRCGNRAQPGVRFSSQTDSTSLDATGCATRMHLDDVAIAHRLKPALLKAQPWRPRAYPATLAAMPAAQGQFAMGQQTKITDGTSTLVIDPCRAQTKLYASISQTANTQLVAGTAAKKIYVCSFHVVVAAAASVALIEGTGSVCATGTTGVSGFGGATAATGWTFGANGGIAYGSGEAALGAEINAADNLCLFNSGAGQVSGGLSYVVQ